HLNRTFGAHVVSVLTGQYEDPEGQAIYYRIPLGPIAPDPVVQQDVLRRRAAHPPGDLTFGLSSLPGNRHDVAFDLSSRLTRPFASGPAALPDAEGRGLLDGAAVTKITLVNYVTPAAGRALGWIGAPVPELPHMYLTSSRDEAVDKALRLIRCTRKTAQVAIG